jgi:pyrimidine operon attenuation protein / uracil phosphoribosyltransferase
MSDVLLDPKAVDAALTRLAAEIAAPAARSGSSATTTGAPPVLVAIARGGEPFAKRIAAKMGELGVVPVLGVVDITLYRDDAATALPNPRIGPSHIPTPIEGRRVVLVDDVLHTGRTIRAALDAVLDYGRPRGIELAVLVDRGGRELPIAATYVGHVADVPRGARVEVMMKRVGPGVDDEEPWALIVPDATGSGRDTKGATS